MTKGKQGFASMDRDRQREIASMGGHAQGKHNNAGNFANNPERARLAGAAGGRKSRRGFASMPEDKHKQVSSQGGKTTAGRGVNGQSFAENPDRARKAGLLSSFRRKFKRHQAEETV
jgi:general stress protein YciG